MNNNNTHCLNCGEKLLGDFCHLCGQQNTNVNLTFTELLADFFGDMLNYDSRFYRTLVPLLFRPGFLTVEFYKGKRIPYVPPLRLYLFISFILFLWLTLAGGINVNLSDPDSPNGLNVNITDGNSETLRSDRDQALAEIENSDSPEWVKALVRRTSSNWLLIADNPQGFLNLLSTRFPYLMFLLLPVFAFILWLHFAKSGYNYLQHFIFTLHFHSFVYLVTLLFSITDKIAPWDYFSWALLVFNIYIALSMRRTYGSSKTGCVLKTLSILTIYGTVLGVAFLAFVLLNVLNYG